MDKLLGGATLSEFEKRKQLEEWLRDYNFIKMSIENLKKDYELIKDVGSGIDISKESTGKTNKFSSEVENIVIKLNSIENKIKQMETLIKKIDNAIEILNNTEKEIIKNRCIENRYYYQFIHNVCISERTAKRIKSEAIRKMTIAVFGL